MRKILPRRRRQAEGCGAPALRALSRRHSSRARSGDARALEALVRRYLRPAYASWARSSASVGLRKNASATDAEDLAQEALMVSLQRLDQCPNPEHFASWLLQSVRHRAINQLNQRKVQARLIDGPQHGATV